MSRLTAQHLIGALALSAAGLVLIPATAIAGVTEPAFYVDGALYRTVGTPTDLSRTHAPPHSWDLLYEFGGAQLNVAQAAPGDRGYNGGRWQVHALSFPDGYAAAVASGDLDGDGVLDSTAEIEVALGAGTALDQGVVKQFECPAIPTH